MSQDLAREEELVIAAEAISGRDLRGRSSHSDQVDQSKLASAPVLWSVQHFEAEDQRARSSLAFPHQAQHYATGTGQESFAH